MHRFYQIDVLENNQLPEAEAIHASRVLRLKNGDLIEIFDGKGNLFTCRIQDIKKKSLTYTIERKQNEAPNIRPALHIAVAPTKNIDRFEWFLEKATEIGISKVTPIITANSERKQIKPERLEKIIVSACKQSQGLFKPELMPLTTFNDFIKTHEDSNRFIAHCEDHEKEKLQNSIPKGESALILIGPEGDFNLNEIELAIKKGFKAVSLSERRLRTETAALVACHTFQLKND